MLNGILYPSGKPRLGHRATINDGFREQDGIKAPERSPLSDPRLEARIGLGTVRLLDYNYVHP